MSHRWALSLNAEGGGPSLTMAGRQRMVEWFRHAVAQRSPAVVFAQETTDELLAAAREAGYGITLGSEPQWRPRSAILTAEDIRVEPLDPRQWPTLSYHGSYLAAGTWRNSPIGEVTLVSVHASPKPVEPELYAWPVHLPEARTGGGDPRWKPEVLWDSDLVLSTLGLMAHGRSPLLAVGDFNESRLHDFDNSGRQLGTWGVEFFERAARLGLVDFTLAIVGVEIPTREGLQLDHILGTASAQELFAHPPVIEPDEAWAGGSGPSDHTALWFLLDV